MAAANLDDSQRMLEIAKRHSHAKEPRASFTASYTFHGEQHRLDEYFGRNFVLGFLILHVDQILLKKYFHDADVNSRFLSNSVAKPFLSVLIGDAIRDGKIKSVNDPVIQYLPYLSKSGFREATIENLLQISSRIQFNEDHLKPDADIHRYTAALFRDEPYFEELAASIPSRVKPRTENEYQSINRQVLGAILEKATGKRLNEYMQEKLRTKIGPQSDAFFYRGKKQPEICAAGCLNVTLRDCGRFGLMAMNGGILWRTARCTGVMDPRNCHARCRFSEAKIKRVKGRRKFWVRPPVMDSLWKRRRVNDVGGLWADDLRQSEAARGDGADQRLAGTGYRGAVDKTVKMMDAIAQQIQHGISGEHAASPEHLQTRKFIDAKVLRGDGEARVPRKDVIRHCLQWWPAV